jgi:hypothetical protein
MKSAFPMEKTLDEVYGLYKTAIAFVDALPAALRECDGSLTFGGTTSGTSIEKDTSQ